MTAMAPIVPGPGEPEFRASGTDLSERRRSGVSRGPLVDIVPTSAMIGIAWDAAGAARIGASTSIAAIAADARLAAAYPGVAAAAGGLATPQIRHLATLGGNLAPAFALLVLPQSAHRLPEEGRRSTARRARATISTASSSISGPCVAPHPSTMATALLAYEAKVATNQRQDLSIEQLLGDGSNGAADHALSARRNDRGRRTSRRRSPANARLTGARSAAPTPNGRWSKSSRAWSSSGARSSSCGSTAGGVAPVPVRLAEAEKVSQGAPVSASTIAVAAQAATVGATPLPMTAYKLDLLAGLVQDLLEQCSS